ncbi:unnamed protein product, partial [Staurois parvus]
MKSPIPGPGFGNGQETDCTGVCRPFNKRPNQGSGLHPGRQESGGLHLGRQE